MNMENNINVVGMVIRAYLNNWRPAPTPPNPHQSIDAEQVIILKSTEDIVAELSDMVDATTGDVALMMAEAGFSIWFRADGRHGWAMTPRR